MLELLRDPMSIIIITIIYVVVVFLLPLLIASIYSLRAFIYATRLRKACDKSVTDAIAQIPYHHFRARQKLYRELCQDNPNTEPLMIRTQKLMKKSLCWCGAVFLAWPVGTVLLIVALSYLKENNLGIDKIDGVYVLDVGTQEDEASDK